MPPKAAALVTYSISRCTRAARGRHARGGARQRLARVGARCRADVADERDLLKTETGNFGRLDSAHVAHVAYRAEEGTSLYATIGSGQFWIHPRAASESGEPRLTAERERRPTAPEHGAAGFREKRYLAIEPPDPRARLHRVAGGETLAKIARDTYGEPSPVVHDERLTRTLHEKLPATPGCARGSGPPGFAALGTACRLGDLPPITPGHFVPPGFRGSIAPS